MPKLSLRQPAARRSWPALSLSALAALLLSACGGVPVDANTGGDGVRDQAMGLFINEASITDSIDGDDGDNTDWRYVDVSEEGRLTLNIAFDRPEKLVGAEVSLHDEFGGRLEREVVAANRGSYVFAQEVAKAPTRFFIRVFTETGRSAYSIGASQSIKPAPPPPPPPPPPPVYEEPEPSPARPPVRQQPVRRAPPVKRATPPPARPAAPPPPVEPAAPAVVIEGLVTRVLAGKDNESCELTIRIKGGAVAKGKRGDLVRGGEVLGKVTVTSVSGSTLRGTVPLPPGKLTGALKVRFR